MSPTPLPDIVEGALRDVTPQQLQFLAHSQRTELVLRYISQLPAAARVEFCDASVFFQAVKGAIERASQLARQEDASATAQAVAFADQVLAEFRSYCVMRHQYPEEFFLATTLWAEFLLGQGDYPRVVDVTQDALVADAARFPGIRVALNIAQAESRLQMGQLDRAEEILRDLVDRPYLVADRRAAARSSALRGRVALFTGDIASHKLLTWRALGTFHSDDNLRIEVARQLSRTYGSWLRPLVAPGVGAWDRMIYASSLLQLLASRFSILRKLRVDRATRLAVLGVAYAANYRGPDSVHRRWLAYRGLPSAVASSAQRKGILVTRAMGGLGDLLMMTPGLRALRRRHGDGAVWFAVPKAFHSIFDGNRDFSLLDIEKDVIDPAEFASWCDLTDCPASRVETRTAPAVRMNRIEIFARAMGVSATELDHSGRKPHYVVSDQERTEAKSLLRGFRSRRPLIGLQMRSAETYRNYPRMEELVERLKLGNDVVVFHSEPIAGLDLPGVFKCDRLPIRTAIAILAECSAFVGPDSSLVHFAAALDLPSLAIFGPIDGRVRTADYPKCGFVDARDKLGCIPCWRNENIQCRTSGTRTSVCLHQISVESILTRLSDLLSCNRDKYGN